MTDLSVKTNFETVSEQQIYALRLLSSKYEYNRANIAEALGVNVGTVNQWFARGRISAQKAIEVESITGGEINKKFMRPDVADWI